jgi:hypothetical protein
VGEVAIAVAKLEPALNLDRVTILIVAIEEHRPSRAMDEFWISA